MPAQTPPPDSSYTDIDDFVPQPTPDAGSGGGGGGGAGGSSAAAKVSDAGIYATPPTPLRVFCGPMDCDTDSSVCCIANTGPSCGAKTASCGGDLTFTCDGPEDCTGGQQCCVEPMPYDGGAKITLICRQSCAMAPTQMCHSASDCPGDRPACCRGETFPLGHCIPYAGIANGDTCDVP